MTSNLSRDFKAACEEIDIFFNILSGLDTKEISICPAPKNSDESSNHQTWVKTLKGAAFLLLYNLVESTVRNSVLQIYQQLIDDRVQFDKCTSKIKRVILKNLRTHNVEKIEPELTELMVHIISKTYDTTKIVPGGNIDARTIQKLSNQYGFSSPFLVRSHHLSEIKNSRNNLAHGISKFSEIGQQSSGVELVEKKTYIMQNLEELISVVSKYLDKKKYLTH